MVNVPKVRDIIQLAHIVKAGPEIAEKVDEVHQVGISCARVVMKSKCILNCIHSNTTNKPNAHFRFMEGNHNSQIISNLACPPPFLSNQKLHSITAMKSSNDSNFDMFTMMKENALFLLELSSTNSRKFHASEKPTLSSLRVKL